MAEHYEKTTRKFELELIRVKETLEPIVLIEPWTFSFLQPTPTTKSEVHVCTICCKTFHKKAGLSRHFTIIRKYNHRPNGLERLPESNNIKFKKLLIYLIHRKLSNGFKKSDRQVISLPCTQNQFFDVFQGHIHYKRHDTSYICTFRGATRNRTLGEILGNPVWGKKFYEEDQQTYVVLLDQLPKHLQNNPLARASKAPTRRRKSKYNYGEVAIEWKMKSDKDAQHNICEAGFLFVHFWVKQIRQKSNI